MSSDQVPDPPASLDPLTETIAARTVLFRVHEPVFADGTANDGTIANPGFGKPSRFAFFGQPTVPVLYLADRVEGAVHESILHEAEPGEFLPRAWWQTKVLTAVEVVCDLTVVAFHSAGLRRLNLFARNLTDTNRLTYPRTVRWAEAAWQTHEQTGAQGVSYMCRHFNSSKALCLFGDQLPADALRPVPEHPRTRSFALPEDAEWLARLALDMNVVIRP